MRDYELYSCTNRRPKMRVWIKEARANFTKLYCTEPELWESVEARGRDGSIHRLGGKIKQEVRQ